MEILEHACMEKQESQSAILDPELHTVLGR